MVGRQILEDQQQ